MIICLTESEFLLTDQSHHQNSQDDPQRVTDDVHEHNGHQSHGQVEFTLSLLAASSTQNLRFVEKNIFADFNQIFSK